MLSDLEAKAVPSIWRLTMGGSPIVLMNDGLEDHNLYCVHSVTGDVGGLDAFARCFGNIRLRGIQVPKRDMTAHLASSIGSIAARHVAAIEAFQPEGPVRLVGWSAGAIIALEMAQQLRSKGREIPLLVALDGAPCNTGAGLSPKDPRYALRVMANVPRWLRDDRSSDWSVGGIMRRVSEKVAARRGAGDGMLRDVGTIDAGAIKGVVARPGWSPAQKTFVHEMYQAMSRYKAAPYDGRVLVFETRTQPLFHLRQVGASWRALCSNIEILLVDGNHSGLISEKTAAVLASEVLCRLGGSAERMAVLVELQM